MAQAQADVDWSDDNLDHAKQFSVGENLAAGFGEGDDPFDSWYTDEKASYDKQKAEGVEHPKDTGHYTNIVGDVDVTGFAMSNSDYTGMSYVQTFNNSAWEGGIGLHGTITTGTLYTIDDYEAAFDAYYDGLMNADQAYRDAQAQVEAAKAALDKADTAATQAHAALDEAAKASERSKADATTAQSKLADATSRRRTPSRGWPPRTPRRQRPTRPPRTPRPRWTRPSRMPRPPRRPSSRPPTGSHRPRRTSTRPRRPTTRPWTPSRPRRTVWTR